MKSVLKFLLLALVLCAAASCNTKNIELKPFISPEGRFSVLTPAAMAHTSTLTRWGGGDVLLHSYAIEHDDVLYVVNYFDLPVDISDEMRKQMKWNSLFPGREELVKARQWTVKDLKLAQVHRGPDKMAEVFAESFKATSANGRQALSVRLAWHENRIYQVTVAHDVVPSFFEIVNSEKFMNSFKLQ